MRWYKHLYVGKKAKKKRYAIIQSVREHSFYPHAYVITLPQNGNNVLDIYPATVLLLPHYKNEDFFVLGIAASYWEALEVVRDMVDEVYQKTGGFDWFDFIKEK